MDNLLNAMKEYQEKLNPYDLVIVTLFSDGSGSISTAETGPLFPFASPAQAVAILKGDVEVEPI